MPAESLHGSVGGLKGSVKEWSPQSHKARARCFLETAIVLEVIELPSVVPSAIRDSPHPADSLAFNHSFRSDWVVSEEQTNFCVSSLVAC